MIKYIGSKRKLIPHITGIIQNLADSGSVFDAFSGTARVGYALKGLGYRVVSNDSSSYAATIAHCYVTSDLEDHRDVATLIKELNQLTGKPGYFTETFCEKSRYVQPFNGERIDAIREEISRKSLDPELEAILLTSLMEAADRVDSTTGLQMAYLKQWAKRSFKPLEMRVPILLPRADNGKGASLQLDVLEAVANVETDVAYLDPPYNQHQYLGNYHVWESLVLWDKPEVYGVACKRVDCKERKSPFNSKVKCKPYMQRLINSVQAKHIVVSFSDEGFITRDEMIQMLSKRGKVTTHAFDYDRYVGAKIGIYNPQGEKVGTTDHVKNLEYLFVVSG